MALTKAPEELLDKDLTSALGITTADNTTQLTLKSTDADSSVGPVLDLIRDSASPADGDLIGTIQFQGEDDGSNVTSYGTISSKIADVTGGTEDGVLLFNVVAAGSSLDSLTLSHNEAVFNNGSADYDFRVESDSSTHMLFVDAGNNTVSIGSSVSDGTLHVESGSAGTITSAAAANELVLESDGPVGMSLLFDDEANDAYGNIYWGNETDGNADGRITYFGSTYVTAGDRQVMSFRTAGTERLRIDGSGNLMIGKTSLDFSATAGTEIRSDGRIFGGIASSAVMFLNRITNDGDILEFRKDGSAVGTIATTSSRLSIGSNDVGIFFDSTNERLTPIDQANQTDRDAAIDLGYASSRFKDLYLSGGAFIGGTTSANQLDDYEEGAFTPQLYGGSTSVTVSNAVGRYTKIGNLVSVWGALTRNDANSITGNLQLRNMPFTVDVVSSLTRMGMGFIWMDNGTNLDRIGNVYIDGNTYAYGVVDFDVRTGRYLQISSMTNGRPIYFSFCYQTGQ